MRKFYMVRKYFDPISHYVLRPFRVLLSYLAFFYVVKESTDELPFGDPEYYDYAPEKYHLCCTASIVLVYLLIARVFALYDGTARRRFWRNPIEEKHRFSEHIGILRSPDFLYNAIGFALLPLFFGLEIFSHPLYLLFPNRTLGKIELYLLYLLCVFSLMMLVDIGFRLCTRTFWRTLSSDEANGMCFDILKLALCLALIAIGYSYMAPLYLVSVPVLVYIFLKCVRSPVFWIILACLVFAFALGKRVRALYLQRRFLHRLQKLCKKASIEISSIRHPYRSIFRYDDKPNFILTLCGKTYAVKLFPALSKDEEMIFADETMGYFKRSLRIRRHEFYSSKRNFRYAFDGEGADHKILLILPVPYTVQYAETRKAFAENDVVYLKESGRYRKLYDASTLFDMTIYSGQAFLHTLERGYIHIGKKETQGSAYEV